MVLLRTFVYFLKTHRYTRRKVMDSKKLELIRKLMADDIIRMHIRHEYKISTEVFIKLLKEQIAVFEIAYKRR